MPKDRFGETASTVFESASCTSQCSQKGKYVQHYKYSIVPVCICGVCTYVMDKQKKSSLFSFLYTIVHLNHLLVHLQLLIKITSETELESCI